MPTVPVKVSYVEMHSCPPGMVQPPSAGLAIVQALKPTLAWYRFLYDTVGRAYHWTRRNKMADVDLAAILHDPLNEVHVLYADGTPAGFVELDRRVPGEIEITQFGLMPEFIGQGLGKYFLRWAIDKAWSCRPQRLWLHTCTLDHRAALPNYLKAGFVLYKETMVEREI